MRYIVFIRARTRTDLRAQVQTTKAIMIVNDLYTMLALALRGLPKRGVVHEARQRALALIGF